MRDPNRATMNAIERDSGGIAIIWCPDLGLRDALVDEVDAMVPSIARPARATTVEDALAYPDRLVLLVPDDEAEVVRDLDANRDRLRAPDAPRSFPIVVFLLRDGDGAEVLRSEATSLWSVTAGNLADPEKLAEVDVDAERRRFSGEVGVTPEAWLARWRAGSLPATAENFTRSYHARLLKLT